VNAREFFAALPGQAEPEQLAGIEHSYLFEVAGEGSWLVEVRDGTLTVSEGWQGPAGTTIATSSETIARLVAGTQNPMTAYMNGKLKISGDLNAALKLQKLF